MQILNRCHPKRRMKYPVNIDWFNERCDQVNRLMVELVRNDRHIFFWKHKGLFESEQLSVAPGADGTHLNDVADYPKYFKNIRAAVVWVKKDLLLMIHKLFFDNGVFPGQGRLSMVECRLDIMFSVHCF